MAEPDRGTRARDALLPVRFTPLQRDIVRGLDEIEAQRTRVRTETDTVRTAAAALVRASRDTALEAAARDRSARVLSEAGGVLLSHDRAYSRDRERIREVERAWSHGPRSDAASIRDELRRGLTDARESYREHLTRLEAQKGLVHPDPARRTGEPLTGPPASAPGPAEPPGRAPAPPALHDRTDRTPEGTRGRATVQPAARRHPKPTHRRRGTAPGA